MTNRLLEPFFSKIKKGSFIMFRVLLIFFCKTILTSYKMDDTLTDNYIN